ncbi:hypothetical protein BSZ22_12425 [Bradyrhizobium canariense]|uniref:Uncharacterized protein n=2 Tax=Bradyrhizobium canariense TaxID=255045 RepID=A0A1X3FWB6_9BRAD|nr:hypothetical protein BSZ22_12425 [Bradyrhizobium canariense]OSI79534.1 hypothetical protein BSZ23_14115 [Bradyrhizobium canariense]OSI91219.1 hypothetical protein BSZ24_17925 [Bradyrhizobium canariense]OSI91843.1 hypothetical protein BSZ25_13770 [Bradyrhizobium canariense]OSJ05652.1 hypothetical protein BSZ16_11550 [Bradyrhizobium canariense]
MQEQQWNEIIDLQFNDVFYCTPAAPRQMVAQGSGGAIISMAGATAVQGMFGAANGQRPKACASRPPGVGRFNCGRMEFV